MFLKNIFVDCQILITLVKIDKANIDNELIIPNF